MGQVAVTFLLALWELTDLSLTFSPIRFLKGWADVYYLLPGAEV